MNLFRKKLNINKLIKEINSKDYTKRFLIMLCGLFISSFAFNLFFAPNNIVVGGISGLSLIIKEYFHIKPSLFISIASVFLIIISFIFIGKEKTLNTLIVVIIYPIFIEATSKITNHIDLETSSLLLTIIFGGALDGLASGLILKEGFSAGGTQIITQIMYKYLHMSLGKSSLIVNSLIITTAIFTFGITKSMYAVIALYISSTITDRVILGVSNNKSFITLKKYFQEWIEQGSIQDRLMVVKMGYISLISYPNIFLTESRAAKELKAAKECYDIFNSLNLFWSVSDNPFTEPVFLKSNVTGGIDQ